MPGAATASLCVCTYQVTPHTSAIVRRLEDSEWVVRKSALWVLRRLPQVTLGLGLGLGLGFAVWHVVWVLRRLPLVSGALTY